MTVIGSRFRCQVIGHCSTWVMCRTTQILRCRGVSRRRFCQMKYRLLFIGEVLVLMRIGQVSELFCTLVQQRVSTRFASTENSSAMAPTADSPANMTSHRSCEKAQMLWRSPYVAIRRSLMSKIKISGGWLVCIVKYLSKHNHNFALKMSGSMRE